MASGEPTVRLAQLPRYWNDQELLKHEPFRTSFACRKEGEFGVSVEWPAVIRGDLGEQRGDVARAFIRWCCIAFQPWEDERSVKVPRPFDFVNQSTYWDLFIEVFYAVYSGSQEEAIKLLNDKRRRLGYTYFIALQTYRRSRNPCPEAVSDLGETANQSTTPSDVVWPHDEDIEAAVEEFIKKIPEGGSYLPDFMEGRRSRRKAAPCRALMSELSQKDREHQKEMEASLSQRRREQKRRRSQSKKSRGHKAIETVDNESLIENDDTLVQSSQQPEGDSGVAPTSMNIDSTSFDAEVIFVNNIRDSCRPESVFIDTSASVMTAHSDVAREKKKRIADSNSVTSVPQESSSGKKKRNREQASNSTYPYQEDASLCDSSPASSKRKKKREKNSSCESKLRMWGDEPMQELYLSSNERSASSVPVSRTALVNTEIRSATSQRFSGARAEGVEPLLGQIGYTTPPTQTLRTSSASSGDTLVDDVFMDAVPKPPERCGKLLFGIETECSRGDCPEDHARLKKMEASLRMSHSPCYNPKPPLPSTLRPLIWAASRQALCETTSWFRCYHGGVYFSDGKAHGYLLGGYASQRDIFCHDGKFIISHGGGKSLKGSQGQGERDASVRALLYNYRERHPLVLLIDDRYAPFPFDLGDKMYVVLGQYWIANAWAEKDVSVIDGRLDVRVKYKFAFQYCEGQVSPWWITPSTTQDSVADVPGSNMSMSAFTEDMLVPFAGDTYIESCPMSPLTPLSDDDTFWGSCNNGYGVKDICCSRCQRGTPRIYKQGWMCLYPNCPDFFRINSEEVFSLDYDEHFLELRPDPDFGKIDLSLTSPLAEQDGSVDSIYSIKGWWCRNCGQLCPREKWECWECSQCNISFPLDVCLPIRSLEFEDQESNLKKYQEYKIYGAPRLTVARLRWTSPNGGSSGVRDTFSLPDNHGQIHLIRGNACVNERADNLFRQYQEEALIKKFLRRYPLRSHHARGRMLTNYFSHNAGAPYKYAVATNVTDPFDRAPACVNGALQLIKDRVSTVLEHEADFNEILTAAYMARQKMSYHTDDEKGLGPVVASLSLGSIALMHFRRRKNTVVDGRAERLLTIVLRHGDVLVMDGAQIQKLYEHTVVPMNYRIAATARCIGQCPRQPDPSLTR